MKEKQFEKIKSHIPERRELAIRLLSSILSNSQLPLELKEAVTANLDPSLISEAVNFLMKERSDVP